MGSFVRRAYGGARVIIFHVPRRISSSERHCSKLLQNYTLESDPRWDRSTILAHISNARVPTYFYNSLMCIIFPLPQIIVLRVRRRNRVLMKTLINQFYRVIAN